MTLIASEAPPRVELLGTRGVRSSRDGIILLAMGAGAWLVLALQWTNAFPIPGTRNNLALFLAGFFFPAAGVFDLWFVRLHRGKHRLTISPEGMATDDHPIMIPWDHIRQVVDDGKSVDVMAVGEKEGRYDGLEFFKRPFEGWAEGEKVLRFYLTQHSIENNFR